MDHIARSLGGSNRGGLDEVGCIHADIPFNTHDAHTSFLAFISI